MRTWLIAIAALALQGCAAGPPAFAPAGNGAGYRDIVKTRDQYRVVYNGDARTTPRQAADMAELRAAQLCAAGAYDYYRVTDSGGHTEARSGGPSEDAYVEVVCVKDYAPGLKRTAQTIEQTSAQYGIYLKPSA